jgi:poly-gamma-glutamate synthesis protein (capsule biosynthesis protein)
MTLVLSAVLVSRWSKFTSRPTIGEAQSQTAEQTSETHTAAFDYSRLGKKLSSISGMKISAELLKNLDEDALTALDEEANDSLLTGEDWHRITGYTLNALVDKYETKLSRDMGNNGKDSFVLGFTGDINFTETGYVMTHAKNMPNSVLDCIDETFQDEMRAADIMLINNEFPYSDRGSPTPGKKYTFRADPDSVKYLNDMGVDIVSLANNHAYDYGYESFVDTISTLKGADIPYVGAGMNLEEASSPVSFLINGYKVSFLACVGVESPIKTPVAAKLSEGVMGSYDDGEMMTAAVREAKKTADYVIAYPHWGIENTTVLTNAQVVNSKKYIDAGADAVVGGHPHVLQGIEFYNGAPVIYSLGNFWFNTRNQPTMLLKLEIGKEGMKTIIVPGTQAYSETHYMSDASARRNLYNKIISWSPRNAISIDDDGVVTEK